MSVQNLASSNIIHSDSDKFTELLENLPKNIIIVDSFQKAHSLICTSKYKKVMCSVSGGSDSDLMVDIFTKIDTNKIVDYVFIDTGLEYKATKEHLTYLEKRYGIEIKRIRSKTPVPLACKKVGQPFISKMVSTYISRLQNYNFKWEDKPFEVLLEEYPNCDSALRWWCNLKGEDSRFNISHNKWLKEFLIENPPYFKISSKCCDLAKKASVSNTEYGLNCTGERKAEGGSRAGHNSCVTFGAHDKYRPIFWYKNNDKSEYEEYADIVHSDCYSEYGLKRTGCAGCPFGRYFEYELEVLKEYEPNLYKAACNIFKDSYEYTRKYREFCKEKNMEIKRSQYGYQYSIFDMLQN